MMLSLIELKRYIINDNNVYSDKRHMLQLKIWINNIRFGQI